MIQHRPHLLPKIRSEGIMDAAEGAPCTLRIASFVPGRRCAGHETTVGCHLPIWGKGKSTKVTDMGVAFGCSACHAIIDGVDQEALRYLEKKFGAAMMTRMLHGLTETHALLIDHGVIVIPDAVIV
ncbi:MULTISPECIES: nuclease domain-containing protein [unclassified Phaeobacter]|uniref:nuclease domain-containing protein n=2 Tax=Phaeobacter TaxID=302485 RepID=UPI003A8B8C4C